MKNKLVIIHFQPLEKYPPVTNFLDYLCKNKDTNILVLTTKQKLNISTYINNSIKIVRFPFLNKKSLKIVRLIKYIIFHLGSFIFLMLYKPKKILYYETLSSYPAILFFKLFKSTNIYVHYHEYTSEIEYINGMQMENYFHKLENKNYNNYHWISHTNKERLILFQLDNPTFKKNIGKIIPNYPPKSWIRKNTNSINTISSPIKLLYVGSISLQTMYFEEIINWISNLNGKVILDIYSFNFPNDLKNKIDENKFICFKGNIPYLSYPLVLSQYTIGLILYKCHIPNVTYCAPNKLFEYLAFGLDVWYPKEMIGCYSYKTKNTFPKVIEIDYNNLFQYNIDSLMSKEDCIYKSSKYYYESVFKKFSNSILNQ